MALTHALSTNNYGPAHLIVATSAANGTHTTLAGAMADAVSGDTIFLRDSVTENVTLTAGVNIAAWTGGTLNTPSITGTLTMTTAGTCNISGIRLVTNSAALLAVTGSAASIVNLWDCYLNCTNNTGITFSAANTSAKITLDECSGDIGTTGISLFTHTSTGTLVIRTNNFSNSGGSSTASTCSAGVVNINKSTLTFPVTLSSTAATTTSYCSFDTSAQNATCLTLGGSGAQFIRYCTLLSGSASAASIGGTSLMEFCQIDSTNTNAVTGAGTLTGNTLVFSNTSTGVNTTTLTPQVFGLQGTFTPTVALGTPGTSSFTYSQQVGNYHLIGSLVFFTIRIVLTNFTIGTGSGQVAIGTLPFAAASTTNQSYSVSCILQNVTFGALVSYYQGQIQASGTTIIVAGTVTAANQVNLQAAGLSNTSTFLISGCYSTT